MLIAEHRNAEQATDSNERVVSGSRIVERMRGNSEK
jgi:hypothetical protein